MWFRLRRNQTLRNYLKIFIFFILLIGIEEYFYTFLYKSWRNYYRNVVIKEIQVQRTLEKRLSIGVLVVVDKLQNLKNYELAQDTVTCYCRKFKYKLIRISMDRSPDYRKKCPQKDFMFQRHCVTTNVLRDNPELEYILFLDADMGIVNPNHLIEEYIDPKIDLTFYERIFNFEVMAGSYIVKNTPYSITFLKDWIEYENKLPQSFHGTDNAAIHQILVDWYNPNDKRDIKCRTIWEESKDWDGVWDYVACARSLLNNTLIFDRIKIISKYSHASWARDGWLTHSHWSPSDFIFHGWQKKRLQKIEFAGWFNPLIDEEAFKLQRCHAGRAHLNWRYKDTFIKSDEKIREKLDKISNEIRVKYSKTINRIWS